MHSSVEYHRPKVFSKMKITDNIVRIILVRIILLLLLCVTNLYGLMLKKKKPSRLLPSLLALELVIQEMRKL